ncbi:MAG: hypothetical protein J0J10_23140 [Bosea sp.]|uniref:hypothetical protein n=1 Tax=Bosea sp. (in: a-proteobacteria) TaxID=1871050 RepID=UPI001AD43A1D|nr:hypothetical protein [Bosea sp. (in: a-proteobacteria)]MBN9471668.1 hypothetical protein [Bosea sp. (in: a-proteobacteria)]
MGVRQGGRYRVDPATGERRRIEDELATIPAPVAAKPEIPSPQAETAAETNPSRARARESKKSEE